MAIVDQTRGLYACRPARASISYVDEFLQANTSANASDGDTSSVDTSGVDPLSTAASDDASGIDSLNDGDELPGDEAPGVATPGVATPGSAALAERRFTVPAGMAGRLDKVLAQLIPEHSRSRLQGWIEAGHVQVNAETATSVRKAVATYDKIAVREQLAPEQQAFTPEPI